MRPDFKMGQTSVIIFLAMTAFGCSGRQIDKKDDEPYKAETYVLVKEKQWTRKYCYGREVSLDLETTRTPSMYVELPPKSVENLIRGEFVNRTTGSRAGLVTNRYGFSIDMADTLLNMKVREGVNEIAYQFYYCPRWQTDRFGSPTETCAESTEVREAGTAYIRVRYDERVREGVANIDLTREECGHRVESFVP